jgi:rubrerythrin
MKIEEAIQTAIQYEKQVVKVYKEAAGSSLDPAGRRIFGILVKEEEQHVAYLLGKLEEWKTTGRVTATSLGTLVPSRSRIEEGIQTLQGKVARKAPESETRLLKRALDTEVETSAFYARVVRELPPGEGKLFERFIEIEQGHEAIVQAEMNAVVGNGFWFDIPEITLEG